MATAARVHSADGSPGNPGSGLWPTSTPDTPQQSAEVWMFTEPVLGKSQGISARGSFLLSRSTRLAREGQQDRPHPTRSTLDGLSGTTDAG